MRFDLSEPATLELALEALSDEGYVILENGIDASELDGIRAALRTAQEEIRAEIGEERLRNAGELGVIRLPFRYAPVLFRLLEHPAILQLVDRTVSATATLHLMNGFILPSFTGGEAPSVFQNRFHRDFPRHLNGHMASLNVLVAVDEFRSDNGATLVVPGSHQRAEAPIQGYMERVAVAAECPEGSFVIFDSTLWHAAGANTSGHDRHAINMQFTRSWIKQQIDYVRAIAPDQLAGLPERSQQLLGSYSRVVTSLDEYYQPPERRLYRSGQG